MKSMTRLAIARPTSTLISPALEMKQAGPDRVSVRGARGRPPSDKLKMVAVYRDGWTASGMLAVVGRNAEAKARAAGELVLERVRRAGVTLADSLVECLGAGDVAPGVLRPAAPPYEVVLRVTVRDPERAAVERFCRELAPLVTAGPPGIVGYASGRPSPRPAFGYWPALVPRELGRSSRPASKCGPRRSGPGHCVSHPNREQFRVERRREGADHV